MRVLVVEDERALATALWRALEAEGFAVVLAVDGVDGDWRVRGEAFDAVVLEVVLPGLSGYEICWGMRARGDTTPVLFLTAQHRESDEVDALDIGDDVMSRPFSHRVLAARLRALVRRCDRAAPPSMRVGTLRVDPVHERVWLGEEELHFAARELAVLTYLIRRCDHVVGKMEILTHVWGPHPMGDANLVEVYIRRLRRRLAPADVDIVTVRGRGYRLSARSR